MKKKIFLDMAEEEVCDDADVIVADGIGSCVVVFLQDKENSVVGGAHVVLPGDGDISSPKRADNLIDEMMGEIKSKGAEKDKLEAKIVGGSHIFGFSKDVGEKNVESVKEILSDKNIDIVSEDTGGTKGRNVKFECDTGKVEVCDSQGNCKYY
jgi:chemotaxis protein CheD